VKLKDIWTLIAEDYQAQRELEKRKRDTRALTQSTLNYPVIEAIVRAAADQQPGFYSVITFSDGARWEFGVKEKASRGPARTDGETF
jgi:hypothetical protein